MVCYAGTGPSRDKLKVVMSGMELVNVALETFACWVFPSLRERTRSEFIWLNGDADQNTLNLNKAVKFRDSSQPDTCTLPPIFFFFFRVFARGYLPLPQVG